MNIYDYAVKWDWCHYSYVTRWHYTVQKLCKYVLWWLEYSGMVRVITHKCTVWWWWLDCEVAANHWAQRVTLGKRIWLLGVITKSVVRKPNIATHAKSVVFYIVLQHCITTCFVISHHSKPTNRFTSFVILSTQSGPPWLWTVWMSSLARNELLPYSTRTPIELLNFELTIHQGLPRPILATILFNQNLIPRE